MVVLTTFPPPTEGIRHTEQNTVAYVKEQSLGKGTLYIAESRVSWFNVGGQGFSLEYPSINLHAVSKDLNSFPEQCLYVMIEAPLEEQVEDLKKDGSESSDDDGPEDPEVPITEIRFVPDNKAVLDDLFRAMSDCQALHPDPADLSDDDFVDGNYEDAEEESEFYFADDGSGVAFVQGDNHENGDNLLINPSVITVRNNLGGGDGLEIRNGIEEEPMDIGQFEDADQ